MTINPDIKTLVATAITDLNTNSLLGATLRKDALLGAILCSSAGLTSMGVTLAQISKELDHLIADGPVVFSGVTYRGYDRTALLAAADLDNPIIDSSTPANGATDVEIDIEELVLTFDQDVSPANGSFTLGIAEGAIVQSWVIANAPFDGADTFTLPLNAELTNEEDYEITVPAAGVYSTLKQAPNAVEVLTFTTIAEA